MLKAGLVLVAIGLATGLLGYFGLFLISELGAAPQPTPDPALGNIAFVAVMVAFHASYVLTILGMTLVIAAPFWVRRKIAADRVAKR